MKSYELKPSRENILETLFEDSIDRNKDLIHFATILNDVQDSCSIALNGRWGSGKTFFIAQLKLILEAYNPSFEKSTSEDYIRVKNNMCRHIQDEENSVYFQPQVAIYYDSWTNDNDIDPILSIIYEIVRSVNSDFNFKKSKSCIQIIGEIAEFFSGKKITSLIDLAKTEDPFSQLKEQKDIYILISNFLDSVLAERGNRLVIFIDELDRCKPSYAVQLLERIKHYFTSDLITFVFSVNLDELQHTIKRYYGSDFDACRYLDRFFDLRISLPPANLEKYYEKINLNSEGDVYENICREVIKTNQFELREIAKFYRHSKAAIHNRRHLYTGFPDNNALEFCLLCIVPIMIGTNISNIQQYNAFIRGEDSSPLINVFACKRLELFICSKLLGSNETYDEPKSRDQIKVKITDKLNEVYNALFSHDYSNGIPEKYIGSMCFTKGTYNNLISAVSLLSSFSDFKE